MLRSVNIIVMGKTGVGKSTLINAVLEEDIAPTGTGQAVTRENRIYRKEMMLPTKVSEKGQYELVSCRLSMYDTVGLEVDSAITDKTLNEISIHISETKKSFKSDEVSVVWFCVSEVNKRFESFELSLIKKLTIEYEIPFVIVITQGISKKMGDLEMQIKDALPDVPLAKVLAKAYPIDDDVSVPAWGIESLLWASINNYQGRKIRILEEKINLLGRKRKERIDEIERKGMNCIYKHSKVVSKIGILAVGCVPFVHGICIKMLSDLNGIVGIKGGKDLASEIFVNAVIGVIATPFMAVPLLSIPVAQAYVEAVGESYLKVLLAVIDKSSDIELKDNSLMAVRIKEELRKIEK